MYTHLDCIALRTVKLSDTKNLLSVWSRQHGRLTLALPAGSSKEARRRRALTTPLATFEGECDIRPDREILSIRDLRPARNSLAIESSPLKNIMAQFLAEVLDLLLRRTEADDALSDFLFSSVDALAAATDNKDIASFHIIFLYRLAHHAGIGPSFEDCHNRRYFDLRDGRFRTTAPLHPDFIQGRECTMLLAIDRAGYRTAHRLPLDRHGRKRTLDIILQYFSIHLSSLQSLKSLDILRELGD